MVPIALLSGLLGDLVFTMFDTTTQTAELIVKASSAVMMIPLMFSAAVLTGGIVITKRPRIANIRLNVKAYIKTAWWAFLSIATVFAITGVVFVILLPSVVVEINGIVEELAMAAAVIYFGIKIYENKDGEIQGKTDKKIKG